MKLLEAAEAAAAGAEAEAAAAAAAAAKSSGGGGGGGGGGGANLARRHLASPLAAFGAGVLLLDDTTAGLGAFLVDQAREWDASAEAAPGRPPVVPDFSAPPPPPPPPSPYFHRSTAGLPLPSASSSTTPSKPSAFGDDEEWGAAARVRDAVAAAEAAAAAWGKILPSPHTLSSPPSSRANSPDDDLNSSSSTSHPHHPHPPLLSADFELAAVRALRTVAEAALPSYGAVVARERARREAADAAAGLGAGGDLNGLRNRRRSDFDDFDDDEKGAKAQKDNENDDQAPRFLRRARPADVSVYRGDWMLRPVQGNEVELLVRPLVKLSVAANRALGLTRETVPSSSSSSSPASSASAGPPPKPPSGLGHPWLDAARDAAVRRNLRINLRPLAEKATLLWLPLLFFSVRFSLRVAAVVWEVLTAPYEPGEWERQFEERVAATMTGENE